MDLRLRVTAIAAAAAVAASFFLFQQLRQRVAALEEEADGLRRENARLSAELAVLQPVATGTPEALSARAAEVGGRLPGLSCLYIVRGADKTTLASHASADMASHLSPDTHEPYDYLSCVNRVLYSQHWSNTSHYLQDRDRSIFVLCDQVSCQRSWCAPCRQLPCSPHSSSSLDHPTTAHTITCALAARARLFCILSQLQDSTGVDPGCAAAAAEGAGGLLC